PGVAIQRVAPPLNADLDRGQEHRLRQVASYLDRRLTEASRTTGVPNDQRILVLTSLLIADELADARDEIEALRVRIDDVGERASGALDRVAKRIEEIAAQLETT
ncbi:MAG: cell division protein ZapA, partial [Pseudomonadota bacterium]